MVVKSRTRGCSCPSLIQKHRSGEGPPLFPSSPGPRRSVNGLSNPCPCWGRDNGGGCSIDPRVFRDRMNVQQDLCSQGTVRPGKRDRPGRRARPFSVSPAQPSPAGKRPTNCIGLTSFLADKLVKIDVSVIVMISRAAAKGPAEPHVGTKRGHSVSAIFPWTFPRVGGLCSPDTQGHFLPPYSDA